MQLQLLHILKQKQIQLRRLRQRGPLRDLGKPRPHLYASSTSPSQKVEVLHEEVYKRLSAYSPYLGMRERIESMDSWKANACESLYITDAIRHK